MIADVSKKLTVSQFEIFKFLSSVKLNGQSPGKCEEFLRVNLFYLFNFVKGDHVLFVELCEKLSL